VVPEAPLRETKHGLVADVEGWFVLNARDSRWRDYGPLGFFCNFEGKRPFRQLGFNINILEPGQVLGRYHRENAQEAFLVLAGTCVLLVEGEERTLRAWDFFHCPAGTEHVFVGAGDGPCAVLMVGARTEDEQLLYPVSELAARYGASAEETTPDASQAYAKFERPRREKPPYWSELPWA